MKAVLDAFWREEFELVLSPAIFAEYRRAAGYPKIRKTLALSAQDVKELEDDLLILALWVEPTIAGQPIVVADPSDDAYLLAAAEGQADCVVSGDRHLLAVGGFEGIPIITPRQFLQKLG